MSKAAEASEPSMQEILASIRKIISDEDLPDGGQATPAEPEDVFADGEGEIEVALEASPEAAIQDVATEATPVPDEVDVSVEDDNGDRMFDPPLDDDEDLLELTPDMEIELEAPTPVEYMESDLEFDDPDAVAAEEQSSPEPEPEPETLAQPEPEPTPPPVAMQTPKVEAAAVPPPVLPSEKILSDTTGAAVGAAFGQLNSLLLDREARTVEDLIRDMLQPMLKSWLDDNLPTLVEKIVREEIERVSRGR